MISPCPVRTMQLVASSHSQAQLSRQVPQQCRLDLPFSRSHTQTSLTRAPLRPEHRRLSRERQRFAKRCHTQSLKLLDGAPRPPSARRCAPSRQSPVASPRTPPECRHALSPKRRHTPRHQGFTATLSTPSLRSLHLSFVSSQGIQGTTRPPPRPTPSGPVASTSPLPDRRRAPSYKNLQVAVFRRLPRPSLISVLLHEAPRPSPERHRPPSPKALAEGSRPSLERRCTPSLKVLDEAPASHPGR
jgi:hypothetical protein